MTGTSYLERVVAAVREAGVADGWSVEPPEADDPWLRVRRKDRDLPAHGWKLHVSATEGSADQVLERVLPVLLAAETSFKLVASATLLQGLNEGEGGLGQVGKFVTVYPPTDRDAVRLAWALHRATTGLRGPAVRTDRPLEAGSLVHYRYGPFTSAEEIDGPEPDDPFGTAPPAARALAGRYVAVSTLHRSPRGVVSMAVDLEGLRPCVLKRGFRDVRIDAGGLDAGDRLRREAALLRRLQPDPRFPEVLDLIEDDGDVVLVLTRLEGQTLHERVTRAARTGTLTTTAQMVDLGSRLASALAAMHEVGIVHRDVVPWNVLVGPDGGIGLVDLELSRDGEGETPPGGTPGFASPQQRDGEPGTVADDVFALGATLFFAATAAEPALAPRPGSLLDRPIAMLAPGSPPALEAIVRRCLEPDPDRRFRSAPDVAAALGPIAGSAPADTLPIGAEGSALDDAGRAELLRRAERICRSIEIDGATPVDIATGSAGDVLALAELADATGDRDARTAAAEAADGLAARVRRERSATSAGLYGGLAGAGAALLRAGQALGRPELVSAAADVGRAVVAMPVDRADLFDGAAGRLRFHLLLWDETGEAEHLAAAEGLGRWLRAALDGAPPEHLGYARGRAGIADALLDLAEATGDGEALAAAVAVAGDLAKRAMPALEDGSGLVWPERPGGPPAGPLWCIGATGIGTLFLHAARLGAVPGAEVADRVGRFAARGGRWLGPEQCHGLAGTIEYLLDLAQATGDAAYVAETASIVALLTAFVDEEDGPHTAVLGAGGVRLGPGFLTGAAGVALAVLRASDPWTRPRTLTRAGFRHRSGAMA